MPYQKKIRIQTLHLYVNSQAKLLHNQKKSIPLHPVSTRPWRDARVVEEARLESV